MASRATEPDHLAALGTAGHLRNAFHAGPACLRRHNIAQKLSVPEGIGGCFVPAGSSADVGIRCGLRAFEHARGKAPAVAIPSLCLETTDPVNLAGNFA
jgi:hypothetical protein